MGLKESAGGFLANFDHPIQDYANTLPYMLGGLVLVCLVILLLSGMYLAPFYVPTMQQAYSSTMNIIQNLPFGEFARSVHLWAANMIVLLLVLHVSRVIISGSYKKPRRMLYIIGVLMLFVILFLTYLGTTLPLDQIGVDAAIRSQQTAGLLGISVPLSSMIGPDFVMHISIMIVILLLLLAMHMYLIEKLGISPKAKKNTVSKKTAGLGNSSFLTHLKLLFGSGLLLTSFIGALALMFPAPLGHPGVYDPSIMITKPVEAILYVNDKMLDVFGFPSLILGPLSLFILLISLPIIDTGKQVYWKKRIPAILLGIFILLWGIYFMYLDIIAPTQYSGVCVNPPVNGTCIFVQNNTLMNVSSLENIHSSQNPPLYFVSNGTPATPADVYGGYVALSSPLPQETPIISLVIAIFAFLGIIILKSDWLLSRLKRII